MNLKKIEATYKKLKDRCRETPVFVWDKHYLKLEFLQHSGSFKARGAFNNILGNLVQAKANGVVAVSRGNHACAVAYAAQAMQVSAKVVLPKDASPMRIEKCKHFGAEVILTENVHEAFQKVEHIEKEESRLFVHPFNGELTTLGTSGVGLEFIRQADSLQEIYVAIGGGGLAAGVASAVKQINPKVKVYGVEPEGADSISRSLKSGKPEQLTEINTIADSLGAPYALEQSFRLCQKYLDDVIIVDDQLIEDCIREIYFDLNLVLEPSGVAALAGAKKLASKSKNKGIILCGANVDFDLFQKYVH